MRFYRRSSVVGVYIRKPFWFRLNWGPKWAPFCNFRGPFFKKGGPQKVFELIGTDCSMRKRTFIVGHFGTLWATKKAWARITAESRMFVWWNNDSNEEEKSNWDSKRLWKFKVSLYSGRQISVVVSDVFEYFISKKKYLSLGLFFWRPVWRGNVNFMRHFFPNCGNPARLRSRINPAEGV